MELACHMGFMNFVLFQFYTCVFGVKYTFECLAVLYQVFRMRWEDKKSRFMRWRRIFQFSRKSLIRQSKPGRTPASRCHQHSFKPFPSVSINTFTIKQNSHNLALNILYLLYKHHVGHIMIQCVFCCCTHFVGFLSGAAEVPARGQAGEDGGRAEQTHANDRHDTQSQQRQTQGRRHRQPLSVICTRSHVHTMKYMLNEMKITYFICFVTFNLYTLYVFLPSCAYVWMNELSTEH